MKNLCRALLIAGVLVLTGWGQMRAKAATSVNSMSDMLVGGAGNYIDSGDYVLGDNVGDGMYYFVDSDTTINLNDKQLNALLRVLSGVTLNIRGSGSLHEVNSNGHVNQNGGNVFGATSAAGQYELISGSIENAEVDAGSIIQTGGEVDNVFFYSNGTGTYSISDGEITGYVTFLSGSSCTLTVSGSGVISCNIDLAGGTLIVNGGTISGDIYLNGGTLQNNGGTITGRIIDGSAPSSSGSSSKDKKSKHKKHTTASADYYYNEETGLYGGLIDGVFAPTTMIPASAYPKFNSFLVKKLQATEAGSTLSVNADPWTSINKAVADAFTEKGDIALALTYKQGDQPCEVTVPAGANLTDQLDENGYLGFAKMGALYGAAPVVETE